MRSAPFRLLFPFAFVVVFGSYAAMGGCKMLEKDLVEDLSDREKPVQDGELFTAAIPTPGAVGDVLSLPQGWTVPTMEDWWQGTQGSEIVPYAYFLHLEQIDSQEPFRSAENIRSYRYLPQVATASNPDGLPVGFAKTTDPQTDVDWMGFTCAACHTAQFTYDDRQVRIEGGPTLADYRSFQNDLNTALESTARDDAKFGRFARAVLGGNYSSSAAVDLRSDLVEVVGNLDRRNAQNESPVVDGYGRIDALGQIFNSVTAYDLQIDANARPPDAPVSYPFLWGTPESDVVQWNGSVANKGAGAVGRNVGELTGVFGHVDIDPSRGLRGYHSSIQKTSLGRMEVWVEDLWAPAWPGDILPPVDAALAARGQRIYAAQCESCHITSIDAVAYDPQTNDRRYAARMVGVDTIGTDPRLVTNFNAWIEPTAVATGVLEGSKTGFVSGAPFGARGSGLDVLAHVIGGVLLDDPLTSAELVLEDIEGGLIQGGTNLSAYKARPLFGVWATAPFLHNGSVPTIYDLLLPVAQRPATFWVGNREFDPVKVGYVTTPGEYGFTFDTSIDGNRNIGHTYGTDLPDADRRALLEYIKSL